VLPMALVIPQGFAGVIHSLQWENDPEPMAVTYGIDVDAAQVESDLPQIAEDLAVIFLSELTSALSDVITLINTEVRWQLDAPPDPPIIGTSTESGTGTETGTVIPQNSAHLVHKRSSTGGRGGRGRMYFPGVAEAEVNDIGVIDPAEVTQWNTALADWLAGINSLVRVTSMVILHDENGAHAADPPRVVTALVHDPVLSTQRRRLRH
jgi:hypothetical protein